METETIHENGTFLRAFTGIHFFFPHGSTSYHRSTIKPNMAVAMRKDKNKKVDVTVRLLAVILSLILNNPAKARKKIGGKEKKISAKKKESKGTIC